MNISSVCFVSNQVINSLYMTEFKGMGLTPKNPLCVLLFWFGDLIPVDPAALPGVIWHNPHKLMAANLPSCNAAKLASVWIWVQGAPWSCLSHA